MERFRGKSSSKVHSLGVDGGVSGVSNFNQCSLRMYMFIQGIDSNGRIPVEWLLNYPNHANVIG